MISISLQDQLQLMAFWLCFARWSAIIFQLPLFGQFAIPFLIKVLTSLMITFAFFKHLGPIVAADFKIVGYEHFWFLTIYQTIVGLIIGYLVKIIMSSYTSAGAMISQQMGFSAVQYFDPNFEQGVGPIEKLLSWVVVILVLTSGALLPMFSGGFQSFTSISLANIGKISSGPAYFTQIFFDLFKTAILLASPILFTNILITCVMGITVRIVPQMNVLMMSFVANIGLGLFVLIVISNEFFEVAYRNYVKYLGQWFQYFK